jgi:hypothetical protein
MLASPSRSPRASGTANSASGCPSSPLPIPRMPLSSLRSRLTIAMTMIAVNASPTNIE